MNILQIITILFDLRKFRYLLLRQKLLIIIIVSVIVTVIPYVINILKNAHARSQIYLNLVEQNRPLLPLNKDYAIIHTSYDIKKDAPISLKFALTQSNADAPKITALIIEFPDNAKVTTSPSSGWEWKKTFSTYPKNEYYIDLSDNVLTNQLIHTFPAFNITYMDIKTIFNNYITYEIHINKIGTVKHTVILSPDKYKKIQDENTVPSLATPSQVTLTPPPQATPSRYQVTPDARMRNHF